MLDLKIEQTTLPTLSVNFNVGGSYIEFDSNTWLCVGGQPASDTVYSLNLASFKLTALPHLLARRCGAGIAKAAGFVYVFGGWDLSCVGQTFCGRRMFAVLFSHCMYIVLYFKLSIKTIPYIPAFSCEKYKNRVWIALRKAHHARWSFTPCVHNAIIYLAAPTTPMESFSPETELFTLLTVAFPLQKLACSVAFVAQGELWVLTQNKQLARWRIEEEREFLCSSIAKGCWSTQPPLVADSLVLIACEGKVLNFSLESLGFV